MTITEQNIQLVVGDTVVITMFIPWYGGYVLDVSAVGDIAQVSELREHTPFIVDETPFGGNGQQKVQIKGLKAGSFTLVSRRPFAPDDVASVVNVIVE